MYSSRLEWFGDYRRRIGVLPTEELHKSKNKVRLMRTLSLLGDGPGDPRDPETKHVLLQQGFVPFYEGKSFHQYTDFWGDAPEFCVSLERMAGKEQKLMASRFYRAALRTVASSTNERSSIFTVLPPGVIVSHSALPESNPGSRCTVDALCLIALCNSFSFDWLLRQQVAANITFNFLDSVPVPDISDLAVFLAHACLRLSCNHEGYAPLWDREIGEAWREASPSHEFPVIRSELERLSLLAAIDALIANAYGLDRAMYDYILSSFSHRSQPKTPRYCLEAFDELHRIGLDAFTQKHDPYWDVSLNKRLAQPFIDLVIPGRGRTTESSMGPLFDTASAETYMEAQLPIRVASSTEIAPTQPIVAAAASTGTNGAFTTIAELLRSRSVITSSDAQQATGLDAAGVRPHLQQLVQQGLAVTEGQRRGMRYRGVNG